MLKKVGEFGERIRHQNWGIRGMKRAVATMIDFDSYFEHEEDPNDKYVGMVQEWAQKIDYELP